MSKPFKPTKEELLEAVNHTVPDLLSPNLKVLFVGINPGLYSAATKRHFARPGNRFWPALRDGGFTEGLMSPFDSHLILKRGYGITNICARATNAADELKKEQLVRCRESAASEGEKVQAENCRDPRRGLLSNRV